MWFQYIFIALLFAMTIHYILQVNYFQLLNILYFIEINLKVLEKKGKLHIIARKTIEPKGKDI